MVEVVTFDPHGDRIDTATAATPEAAILAARTLHDDAVDARGIWGFTPSVGFYVNGELVRLVNGRP